MTHRGNCLDILPEPYRQNLENAVPLGDEDDHRTHRIQIGQVVVRYTEDMFNIQVTVEGDLSSDVLARLRCDIAEKLAALEQSQIAYRDIEV